VGGRREDFRRIARLCEKLGGEKLAYRFAPAAALVATARRRTDRPWSLGSAMPSARHDWPGERWRQPAPGRR
jgi:hypothetical protein